MECVVSLVDELRRRGLLHRWFFIRYWLEGPHVRLRLRPAGPAGEAAVRRLAETRVQAFLRARPAAGDADPEASTAASKRLFLAEYSEREWDDRYGPDGVMPVRPAGSYAWLDYEPEYGRYGGQAGVDLAEWHFERSSDLVLGLLTETDVARRSLRLGLAAQLMTVLSTAFLRDGAAVAEYLAGYRERWSRFSPEPDRGDAAAQDRGLDRIGMIHRLVASGRTGAGSSPLGAWAAHCAELRGRAAGLARERRLVFGTSDGAGGRHVVGDPDQALRLLLGSYLHMTNNRLGVTLGEEAFLAGIVRRGIPYNGVING